MSLANHPRNEEALELLLVWYFLKTKQVLWPAAVNALENRINELLENPEDWKPASIGPAQRI